MTKFFISKWRTDGKNMWLTVRNEDMLYVALLQIVSPELVDNWMKKGLPKEITLVTKLD